jgi:hypothetical protein
MSAEEGEEEKNKEDYSYPELIPEPQESSEPFSFILRVQIRNEIEKLKKDVVELTKLSADNAQVLLINFKYSYDRLLDEFVKGLFLCILCFFIYYCCVDFFLR